MIESEQDPFKVFRQKLKRNQNDSDHDNIVTLLNKSLCLLQKIMNNNDINHEVIPFHISNWHSHIQKVSNAKNSLEKKRKLVQLFRSKGYPSTRVHFMNKNFSNCGINKYFFTISEDLENTADWIVKRKTKRSRTNALKSVSAKMPDF